VRRDPPILASENYSTGVKFSTPAGAPVLRSGPDSTLMVALREAHPFEPGLVIPQDFHEAAAAAVVTGNWFVAQAALWTRDVIDILRFWGFAWPGRCLFVGLEAGGRHSDCNCAKGMPDQG